MPPSKEKSSTLKRLSEKQLRRRGSILSAARELLSKKGYKGVTMRLLAEESGVALKTLYDYYRNKDDLLREAIEDRYALIYGMIEADDTHHGFDRLQFIGETIVAAMFADKKFAKEMLLLRQMAGYGSGYDAARLQTYKRPLQEIERLGDFNEWVDVEFLAPYLVRQVGIASVSWAAGRVADDILEPYYKLNLCMVLDGLTVGETQEQVRKLQRELFKSLRHIRL